MDFLVIFVALVVPNLPDVTLETGHVGMTCPGFSDQS